MSTKILDSQGIKDIMCEQIEAPRKLAKIWTDEVALV